MPKKNDKNKRNRNQNQTRTPRPRPKVDFTIDQLDYRNTELLQTFVTGHECLQQLRVAVVQLVDGEIHLRARARCARLVLIAVPLILVVLLGHVT